MQFGPYGLYYYEDMCKMRLKKITKTESKRSSKIQYYNKVRTIPLYKCVCVYVLYPRQTSIDDVNEFPRTNMSHRRRIQQQSVLMNFTQVKK